MIATQGFRQYVVSAVWRRVVVLLFLFALGAFAIARWNETSEASCATFDPNYRGPIMAPLCDPFGAEEPPLR
jgi:hypothetical protein